MCGIAGIVSLKDHAPVDAALAQRMADVIAHRGPDADGVYVSPDRRAALANRRLAIVDLSAAGRMPMPSASVKRRVDEEAVYHFLSFLTSPAPKTLFEGIYKLPPGHYAILDADGNFHVTEYWDVYDAAQPHPEWTSQQWQEALMSELRESIR